MIFVPISAFLIGRDKVNLPILTRRQSDAVALGVEQPPDLLQVTVSLDHVLQLRRLHQVGVALVLDPLDTLRSAVDEHRGPRRLHERPHALVGGDLRVPEGRGWDGGQSAEGWCRGDGYSDAIFELLTTKEWLKIISAEEIGAYVQTQRLKNIRIISGNETGKDLSPMVHKSTISKSQLH